MASYNDAHVAATEILENVWGSRGFPVDSAWIARSLGLDVLRVDLDDNVSGALIKQKGKDPVIFINARDNKQRQRFSCAHELGHYVQRTSAKCEGGDTYEYVDLRSDLAKSGTDQDEIFANRFAACLLMPEDEVRRLATYNATPVVMAFHFNVSAEAMRHRLNHLKLR